MLLTVPLKLQIDRTIGRYKTEEVHVVWCKSTAGATKIIYLFIAGYSTLLY